MADVLPDGIRKIFDNADAQTARWRELCGQVVLGTELAGKFAQDAQTAH